MSPMQKNANNGFNVSVIYNKALFYLKKYIFVFLFISILAGIGWYSMVQDYGGKRYIGSALLKLDLPRDRRMDIRAEVANVVGVLNTTRFLQKVIDSTKLQFTLLNSLYSRDDIFDYINYNDSVITGDYTFEKKGDYLKISVSNEALDLKNFVLFNKAIASHSDTLSLKGLQIKFNPIFWRKSNEFKLNVRIHGRNSTLALLRQNFQTSLSGRNQYLKITYKNNDKKLALRVTNTIAQLFINENVLLKTFKLRKLIAKLTNQLQIAEKNLSSAEENLKKFRQLHPTTVLEGEQIDDLQSLNQKKIEENQISNVLQNLNNFVPKLKTTNLENQYTTALEMLQFLTHSNVSGASVYVQMLTEEYSKYQELLQRYPIENPEVQESKKAINEIIQKIIQFSNEQRQILRERIASTNKQISRIERKLKNLPGLQLQLAKLLRERNIYEQTYVSIKQQLNDAKVAQSIENPDILLIDSAMVSPDFPPAIKVYFIKYIIPLGLIFFIPLLLSLGLAFIDRNVFDKDEILAKMGNIPVFHIPVIGKIDDIPKSNEELQKNKMDPKLTTVNYSSSLVNESFRNLRANVINSLDYLKSKKVVMITSFRPGEGKSLIAGNLAITLAQNKIKTLIIDSDLRRGIMHNMFAVNKSPGLSNLLALPVELTDEIILKVVQSTQVPNLYMLSCGDPVPNPSELLSSRIFEQFLSIARKQFDAIIIDTSPIGITSDPLSFIQLTDASLIVALAKKTKIDHLVKSYQKINSVVNSHVMGIILNGHEEDSIKEKYSYSYYNY